MSRYAKLAKGAVEVAVAAAASASACSHQLQASLTFNTAYT